MSSSGQYQGSQAFNNSTTLIAESVNPNTGSLNFCTTLVNLQGIRESVNLKVNLFYAVGSRGTFGLPPGWGLDLPYVLHGKSITAHGRNYVIDREWEDIEQYASGLRYTNNHGIKFEDSPAQLPSGRPQEYRYKLRHVDGSMDFFDELGKPMEHHDIYGNFYYYEWLTGEEGGVDSSELRLESIVDSFGQTVKFAYEQGRSLTITLPDGSETFVQFSLDGVSAITDAEGNRTEVDYALFNDSFNVVSSISHASGLVSKFDYLPMEFLNAEGKLAHLPAVEDYRRYQAGKVCKHTRYAYGEETSQTYTGAAIGCTMGGSSDSLMDDMDKALAYEYDVITSGLDEDEKAIERVVTRYNNLHLPTLETRYALNENNGFIAAQMTRMTYSSDQYKPARTASYNLPIKTEAFCNASSSEEPVWQPLTMTEATYDHYGNAIATTEWMHASDASVIKLKSTRMEYVRTEASVQMPVKQWITDELAHTLEYKECKASADGRSIEFEAAWFQKSLEAGSKLEPGRESSFEFDKHGRQISATIAWSAKARFPAGSIASATTKTEYSFSKGILSRTEVDANGNSTLFEQDVRRANAPLVRKVLPLGQEEKWQYDRIGRLVKHTNALGASMVISYATNAEGTSQTTTSPLGYVTQTSFDVLGREVRRVDNGDPTIPASNLPSRVLSTKKYDNFDQVIEATDMLGVATKSRYDSLRRAVEITDVHGNVVTHDHEQGGPRVRKLLNGHLKEVVELDALRRPTREIKYADSVEQSQIRGYMTDVVYNAAGTPLTKTTSQLIDDGSELGALKTIDVAITTYGPGQVIETEAITGHTEDGIDTVMRRYDYDLFQNRVTYRKETTYAGGSKFTHHGPLSVYNAANQLVAYRNQIGQEEKYEYDGNGWPKKTVRFDGSESSLICNAIGQTTGISSASIVSETTFDADGRLTQTNEGSDNIRYVRGLDGTLIKIEYQDGRSQSFFLDRYSRVVKEVDALGVAKETEYDNFGQVARQSCQGDTFQYAYGVVNHARGQRVGYKARGSREYQTDNTFDAFGCLAKQSSYNSSAVLLETAYEYDARSKVRSIKSSSSVFPEHNHERTYRYDGLGQLISESRLAAKPSKTTYQYDGNSNVLSVDVDGQLTTMSYNEIDQRTDSGFKWDANGRLIQDDERHIYLFDDRDRLVSVSQPSDAPTTEFTYRSDNRVAQRRQGTEDITTFFHGDSKINAVHKTGSAGDQFDEKTSLLSGPDSLLSGYMNGTGHHLLSQLGSTTVVMDPSSHSSAQYSPYGETKVPSSGNMLSSFGFTQALTDPKTGLIYLSSRFYNPRHMSFISMDALRDQENRYSYCAGDPVNRIDPTGHSWEAWESWGRGATVDIAGTLAGAGVAYAVTLGATAVASVITGGAALPLFATVLCGALGGAIGSATSLAVSQFVGGRNVTASDYVFGAITGAITGGLAAGLGASAAKIGESNFREVGKLMLGGAARGAINGAVGDTLAQGYASVAYGREFSFWRLGMKTLLGAGTGAVTSYMGRRTYLQGRELRGSANDKYDFVDYGGRVNPFERALDKGYSPVLVEAEPNWPMAPAWSNPFNVRTGYDLGNDLL